MGQPARSYMCLSDQPVKVLGQSADPFSISKHKIFLTQIDRSQQGTEDCDRSRINAPGIEE